MVRRCVRKRLVENLPLMTNLLPITLMFSAFAIDVAYLELSHTEMFLCADAVIRGTVPKTTTPTTTTSDAITSPTTPFVSVLAGKVIPYN